MWRAGAEAPYYSVPPEYAGLVAAAAAAAPVAVVSAESRRARRVSRRRQAARGGRALSQLLETLAQPAVQRLDGRRSQFTMHLQPVLQNAQLTADRRG